MAPFGAGKSVGKLKEKKENSRVCLAEYFKLA